MLALLNTCSKHILFTGDTGTGKTVNINQFLAGLPPNQIPLNFVFSAATSANQLEDLIFSKMSKRRARVFGPAMGKRFIIFVDDMNMPSREVYGAQPPIELLRQYMDFDGIFDRSTLEFVNLVDINFIGGMGPPGGGRNPITPRFLRHFNQIAHAELSEHSMKLIFSTIVSNCLTKFEDEVKEISDAIVNGTIDIYNTVCSSMLPTPAKSHYTFNLRDLSAVYQGFLSASPKKCNTTEICMRLWIHENQRVFKDRLINDEDRKWFDKLCATNLEKHFERQWDDIITGENLLFGDYMDGMGAEQKNYAEVSNITQAQTVMEECLRDYNEENSQMKLVMFPDAIEHVSRIARVLRQPGGNSLLLGVGGSGRSSLTRLASFVSEYKLCMVQVHKNYTVVDWHEDLKNMLLDAGLKEQPTVFLFNDTQIINESFLEDVNNILNSGDVPNLYSAEDMDNIFVTCKADCQRKGIASTQLNAFGQYLHRVKQNLHVVLAMSPIGDVFRTRLRMFPALVNCCTIDWFADWPVSALQGVAAQALAEEDYELGEHQEGVVSIFCSIHSTVAEKSEHYKEVQGRYSYVTPTSYLELLSVFKVLLAEKRKEVGGLRNKLQGGLDKLKDAEGQVDTLKAQLIEKQPVLVETQKEVAETMATIEVDTADAAVVKEAVTKQQEEADKKATECNEIKSSAEADLAKALPALAAAVECLKELQKKDIDEVRNFKKPPGGVVLTMEATCIMLKGPLKLKIEMVANPNGNGKVADYWKSAAAFLKNPQMLLDTLKAYDKDNIPDSVIAQITPFVNNPDFTVAQIEKASKACKAICMWVHAMYTYSEVAKEVEPKRQALAGAEAELEVVNKALAEANAKLKAVSEKLQALDDKFQAMTAKSQALQDEVKSCEVKLERADILIGGLGGEKARWTETVAKLTVAYDKVIGDVLVSCGTVAYLGAYTAEYRKELTNTWRENLISCKIPHSEMCDVIQTLAVPVQIRAWNIAGLPTDAVSTENGIIMDKARRWPLMIDPQEQAAKFIKNLGDEKFEEGMTICKLTDKSFIQVIENSVRFGKWVLIDAVQEELDPALEPILLQQYTIINGTPNVKIGENMVPFNEQFKLYMASKLPNPHYPPELQVKVTLLNFTITPSGLEDQMLGVVVAKEAPDVEQKKNALVISNARMKKQLQEIEDNILKLLSESSGDILDDEELINVLAESNKTSLEINERVKDAAVTEKEIDEARKLYKPVAYRASILYFCIADLCKIDPMYQYSLQWFAALFAQGISQTEPAEEIQQRLENLNDCITKLLFSSICRSLFEVHKTLFAFLLSVRILGGYGKIDADEYKFLVAGAPPSKETANPAPEWMVEAVWTGVLSLSDLPKFKGFDEFVIKNITFFKKFFDSAEPHNEELPAPWCNDLDDLEKLLVLRIFRSDKVNPALQKYVAANMGSFFNEPPQFNLPESYKDATNSIPLVFVLSKGADPAKKLVEFATEQGFIDKFNSISLGQGQGVIAERYINNAKKIGGWVLLQNCHLAESWLPTLEVIIAETKGDECHEDYRLWLTSMPSKKFPVSILQNGVKMTNEPPKGLRANLMRSYLNFTDDDLKRSNKPNEFQKLLFSLCFLHAVILDRKKFGPLGWNIGYEFTEGDLSVCITQLRSFVDLYEEVPYQVIHFLTYDVNYGGRVTDDKDRRTIETILDDYICPSVLSDDYKFSESGRYTSIPSGNVEHYLEYITAMDIIPEPEVFCMHDNADITSAMEATDALFGTLLVLLPKAVSGGGKSRDEVIDDTCVLILGKLPEVWEMDTISKKYPTSYNESMNTVLVQEAIRFNRLTDTAIKSLKNLRKALKGEMVMTGELEKMADALYTNLVPAMWASVSYPSLMPLASWMSDYLARIEFLQNWIDTGTPKAFWISGFFFPQAFMTGTLQNYARKYTKPIDAISFGFQVMDITVDSIASKPEDGCYIYGLFLQGCRWDASRKSLVDSRPKELFTTFPVMWLKPEVERKAPITGMYECPIYKTLIRAGTLSTTGHSTNFVLFVEIPTTAPGSKWIKAGVALFCALKY